MPPRELGSSSATTAPRQERSKGSPSWPCCPETERDPEPQFGSIRRRFADAKSVAPVTRGESAGGRSGPNDSLATGSILSGVMERPRDLALLLAVSFASGAAALVYEILWVRLLGDILGGTAYAVTMVVALFFLGMGIGSWWLGRIADERSRPLRLFCLLELVIAIWGLASWSMSSRLDALHLALTPSDLTGASQALLKGSVALLLLGVPTIAMGGTLPSLVRHAVRRSAQYGSRLGLVYGANTLGGAFGVLLAVLVFLPRLGLDYTGLAAAALNGIAIVGAWLVGSRSEQDALNTLPPRTPSLAAPASDRVRGVPVLPVATALSGAVAIGLEVLWTRALAMRLMSTVYSFGIVLFSFLFSLGIGSLLTGWLERRGLLRRLTAAFTLAGAGVSGLISLALLARMAPVADPSVDPSISFQRHQLTELARALSVVAVPTAAFGLNFPILARLLHQDVDRVGGEFGRVVLFNTAGSVLAPLLCGFILLPFVGLSGSIVILCLGAVAYSLLVLLPHSAPSRRTSVAFTWATLLLALLALALGRGEVGIWRQSPDDRLLYYRDTMAASIAVVERRDGSRILKIDNTYHLGGTYARFAQERQGLIPVLLSPSPGSVLFIGLGTGSSAGAVVEYGLEAVDVLEIIPGLAPLLPLFGTTGESLASALRRDGPVRLLEVDGRHYVRTTSRKYDVVVGDLFVPWRAGEAGMYTHEHFQSVREILTADGLFCQWLPLYQLSSAELATIFATFCEAFPSVEAFWLYLNVEQPAIGLLGSRRPIEVDADAIATRLHEAGRRAVLERNALVEPSSILSLWITDREGLRSWAADAPVEARYRPRVEFLAPRHRFGVASSPAETNTRLMTELTEPFSECGLLRAGSPEAIGEIERFQGSVLHFFRGRFALVFQRNMVAAVDELQRALVLTPEWDWIAWNLEQVILQALQDRQLSVVEQAARALELSSGKAYLGYYYLAAIAARENRTAEARKFVLRSLELESDYQPAQALRESIGALEGNQ